MSIIRKSVTITASPERVYEAITHPEAYRGWWCGNSAVADWTGGESMLHFRKDGEPVSMRFTVDQLAPDSKVGWTCVANDAEPWIGTTLNWELNPQEGSVDLSLEHGGWQMDPPQMISDGWDHFLGSLKAYVETGEGQPW